MTHFEQLVENLVECSETVGALDTTDKVAFRDAMKAQYAAREAVLAAVDTMKGEAAKIAVHKDKFLFDKFGTKGGRFAKVEDKGVCESLIGGLAKFVGLGDSEADALSRLRSMCKQDKEPNAYWQKLLELARKDGKTEEELVGVGKALAAPFTK